VLISPTYKGLFQPRRKKEISVEPSAAKSPTVSAKYHFDGEGIIILIHSMRALAFVFGETPDGVVRKFFRQYYGRIFDKVARQVRRSPRRQTGKFKTNRANRWSLDSEHPDYTAKDLIPLIEAKLLANWRYV